MTTCQPICWNQSFLSTAKFYSKDAVLHSQYGRRHSASRLIFEFKMNRNHKWRLYEKKGVVTEHDMKEHVANSFSLLFTGLVNKRFPARPDPLCWRSLDRPLWPFLTGLDGPKAGPMPFTRIGPARAADLSEGVCLSFCLSVCLSVKQNSLFRGTLESTQWR